jgi:predicted ATPase
MLKSIEFKNYKALRQTTLPLAPFTLLLGPNGSGKTSVLQALQILGALSVPQQLRQPKVPLGISSEFRAARSVAIKDTQDDLSITLNGEWGSASVAAIFRVTPEGQVTLECIDPKDTSPVKPQAALSWIRGVRTFALEATAIAQPAPIDPQATLKSDGTGLPAVLDNLKDNYPERYNALLGEICRWLPEYDNILYDVHSTNRGKSIAMRTRRGGHRISAKDLSQGTLVGLALLTLAYLPDPPSLVGLEEIDRGLHPRLLRHVQDALYRLSYPQSCGETRPPIQVIATTHSPYLLDLYREHPDEVVLAQKSGLDVTMRRLADIEHFEEILGDAPLSDVWYSGVLGGVPQQ